MQTAFHAAYNNDRIKSGQNEKARQDQNSERQKEYAGGIKTVEQTGGSCPAAVEYMRQLFMPDEKSRMPGI
jgi:hypothetical protein